MSKEKQETVSISTFKEWPFEEEFIIECENGKVTPALCKYYSEVSYDELMREAKYRGLTGSVLNSVNYYCDKVTYIHNSLLISLIPYSISFSVSRHIVSPFTLPLVKEEKRLTFSLLITLTRITYFNVV